MTEEDRFKKWQDGHKKWLKDPKNRKHLSDKNKEFWKSEEGEKQKQINSDRNTKWWDDKDESEFVLGKRYQQKSKGERCEEGYRDYMREFQRKWRADNKDYYKWLYQKRTGKTDLNYDMWKYFNKWRKA